MGGDSGATSTSQRHNSLEHDCTDNQLDVPLVHLPTSPRDSLLTRVSPSCLALLHYPTAAEAVQSAQTADDDLSIKILLRCSQFWAQATVRAGAQFVATIPPARPISFPLLLLGFVNNLIQTPESLSQNQTVMGNLRRLSSSGRKTCETLAHVVRRHRRSEYAASLTLRLTPDGKPTPTGTGASCAANWIIRKPTEPRFLHRERSATTLRPIETTH